MRTQICPTPRAPLARRSTPVSLLAALLLAASCSDTAPTAPDAGPPSPTRAVLAASGGGALVNGGTASGSITAAGQTDSWTFSAAPGDYIAVAVGETSGSADFTPWVRLVAPNGSVVGNHWSAGAAQVAVNATQTGSYTVIVGTADSGNDGTGSYLLTLIRTSGTLSVSAGDQGGAMQNGATHPGTLYLGDIDSWTFPAAPGDYLVVSLGEVSGSADFTPWVRLVAPNGSVVGNHWSAGAAQVAVNATQTGSYTVIVGTADSGYDGTGDYRVTLAKAPGSAVKSAGDQGGALKNGGTHSGNLYAGDVDQWKFSANTGDYLAVSLGEVSGSAEFTPWVRLVAPNGSVVGNHWGAGAAQVAVNATQTGSYTVIVGTADSGYDGTGSYKVTLAKGPGSMVVSRGDQGGTMKNGANHSGSLFRGDVDQWKITATQGDYLVVSLGEVSGSADFTPWVRLVAPNGSVVGNHWSAGAAQVAVNATQTGSYTVIVGTADSGYDATGSYKVRLAQAPDAFVVPSGDEGGAMTNGSLHSGKITIGDLDLWTFDATQGSSVTVAITEVSGSAAFTPWIRLFAPDGTLVGNHWGASNAQIGLASAPQTGKYTVIAGTADSGFDGTGSYQLSVQGASVASTSISAARTR